MRLDPTTGAVGGTSGVRMVALALLVVALGAGGALAGRALLGDDEELDDDACDLELHEVDLQDDEPAADLDDDDPADVDTDADDEDYFDEEELPVLDRHALLEQAMDDYIHGRYADAIAAARVVERYPDPFEQQRAIRIAGASSCFLHDHDAAATAWDKLDHPMDRAFLRYVCHRNDLEIP